MQDFLKSGSILPYRDAVSARERTKPKQPPRWRIWWEERLLRHEIAVARKNLIAREDTLRVLVGEIPFYRSVLYQLQDKQRTRGFNTDYKEFDWGLFEQRVGSLCILLVIGYIVYLLVFKP